MDQNKVELSDRLRILVSHALERVDIESLCNSDDKKWSLIAFMIGCVCNSRVLIESRAVQIEIVAGLLSEIFEWPEDSSKRFVMDAFEDADRGECTAELEAGSRSIRDFEAATDRLGIILDAHST